MHEETPPQTNGRWARLSRAARTVWAKHDRATETWLPLWRHLADSAAVAGLLWDRWLPRNVKEMVAEVLPGGADDARRLAVWLAGTHDIGKATPAFACQVDSLADAMIAAGLRMRTQRQYGEDRKMAPHGLAGQLLLQEWLVERHGWTGRAVGQFGIVAGGHHGVPPDHSQIHDLMVHPELLRTPGAAETTWHQVQTELLDACAETYDVAGRLGDWRKVKLPQPVQVLLTALVIVSDWIASNPDLFPYFPEAHPRSDEERVKAAWAGLRLPPPWTAAEPTLPAAELIASRFDLPPGARVRPVQEDAVRLAREMPEPGLMVIEAPMGEGKTEAALAVAEIFAARSGAGGCYFALPTMATSNAMFPRLLAWLDRLPSDTLAAGDRSVLLAHAKAALQKDYALLMRKSRQRIAAVDQFGQEDDPRRSGCKADGREVGTTAAPADLIAHQWLRGRKKGLLASFAVGTIDQLLMVGLKSRHLALRHLAMAGKVVVIDEVHAYDTYMNSYLDQVLSWLGAYRVPVVVLSATLPASRRRELVEAYTGTSVGAAVVADIEAAEGYPLLTAVSPGSGQPAVLAARPAASGRRADVALERLGDDYDLLADRLGEELAEGGCALVVRNTVDRVMETAACLRARFGAEHVTVAHARFVDVDRARKDADLLARFGPPDQDGTSPARPRQAHIVVASQVVEQSLDVDFDLLVTDLCPVDLLLQRMGRLHRHPRADRPRRLRSARCLVTGVDWQTRPVPSPVRGSRTIYRAYPLLRSLAVLAPHFDQGQGTPVRLPEDISGLVGKAYGAEDPCPKEWGTATESALAEDEKHREGQRSRAAVFRLGDVLKPGRPLIGWIDAGVGDADDSRTGRAQVRDSRESLEVLVVMRRSDGGLITLPWLGDGQGGLDLPTDAAPSPRAARAAAASGLRLPYHFSFPEPLEKAIGELERNWFPAWQEKESHWLAGELILVLDEDCRTRLADWHLRYDPEEGLLVARDDSAEDTGMPAARTALPRVVGPPSFNLVDRPWLPVQLSDGTERSLSLLEVFDQARTIRRLVGDLPTQEFALLRLLLAVLYDAVDGPEDIDAWAELWESDTPFAPVADYLREHREKFDLLHPTTPFFQVADLRTAKDEVASLNRLVADVPNGEPFFTMRMPGVDRLSFAEAARWLVHAQAYDPSGIKSGAVGDPRVKSGKGYPQGVGWAGNLGGVMVEADTLHETLLLNLVARDTTTLDLRGRDDRPAWSSALPHGPAKATDLDKRPYGLRDLYTWQSRRVRLHHDAERVHGVVLAYGDPLAPLNLHLQEPMTGWRRSPAQEKKHGLQLAYLPREHDPAQSAWRGLRGLLAGRDQGAEQRQEGRDYLRPRVLEWLARLIVEGALPSHHLIRARTIGARYGTQQSVIDEVIDDGVLMPVVLLHEGDPRYGQAAIDALGDGESAVNVLGDLAADLARAAGAEEEPRKSAARDLGFAALDTPFRRWLCDLVPGTDPVLQRDRWKRRLRTLIGDLGTSLLNDAGLSAWEGRVVSGRGGSEWLNDAAADRRFRLRLNKFLTTPVEVEA
ncbi:type I-E CRISPR-associated protein Cse1/CasA [Peterkaempfera bronchialis]|uniref:type I-E CRISPR-associated protein Cse1/CasA n=1 Tax=Peterkaempfera bronchialis TaxID=2126346 RepID=UPI003C2EC3CE